MLVVQNAHKCIYKTLAKFARNKHQICRCSIWYECAVSEGSDIACVSPGMGGSPCAAIPTMPACQHVNMVGRYTQPVHARDQKGPTSYMSMHSKCIQGHPCFTTENSRPWRNGVQGTGLEVMDASTRQQDIGRTWRLCVSDIIHGQGQTAWREPLS